MAKGAPICRQGDNRISGMKIPIIFVPGIMGSRVNIPSMSDKWDPDSKRNMLGWSMSGAAKKRRILNFANPGDIAVQPGDRFKKKHDERVSRGWGGVRWASYGQFLELMEGWQFGSHKTPVYAYGYDWRQPIIQLGCQFAADITGETVNIGGNSAGPSGRFGSSGILGREEADKCVIITHSMGGLVTRTALKACASLRQKTVGVMHGVQPATGATVMYRRMITGMFEPYDGGSDIESKVLRAILGRTGDDVGTLASALPGALQLLPFNLYRDRCRAHGIPLVSWTVFEESRQTVHSTDESVYDTYNRSHTDSPPGIVRSTLPSDVQTAVRMRIAGVRRFHEYLSDWKYTDRTWAFLGTTRETDSTLHFDLPPKSISTRRSGGVLGIGSKTVYEATDAAGHTVQLDADTDILRNGFNPEPANARVNAGYGPYGDSTVPQLSASALFPHSEIVLPKDACPKDYRFHTHRQFKLEGVEHEPAYREYPQVQELTAAWLAYIIASIPRK